MVYVSNGFFYRKDRTVARTLPVPTAPSGNVRAANGKMPTKPYVMIRCIYDTRSVNPIAGTLRLADVYTTRPSLYKTGGEFAARHRRSRPPSLPTHIVETWCRPRLVRRRHCRKHSPPSGERNVVNIRGESSLYYVWPVFVVYLLLHPPSATRAVRTAKPGFWEHSIFTSDSGPDGVHNDFCKTGIRSFVICGSGGRGARIPLKGF